MAVDLVFTLQKFAALLFFCLGSLIPAQAQQSPEDILDAVVGLRAAIPPDARTAPTLGFERSGSGVVIDRSGLVLTIGYLILEAATVSLRTRDGVESDARIVAYDHATGFGLVRAEEPLEVPSIELGNSGDLESGDPVLVISSGGSGDVRAASVIDRRDFAGYWEYLLEDAIFTTPPHPRFSGSALLGPDNRLVGIGSLIVSDAGQSGEPQPGNMFVPIDELKPILSALVTTGRNQKSRRPWIGLYPEEYRGLVIVNRVAEEGPAALAGLRVDDVILKVAGLPVSSMSDLYKAMWDLGDAGVEVPLTILRNSEVMELSPTSTDRYDWLKIDAGRLSI